MQYESVILDLLTRVMKLEEEVRQLSEKLNQLEQLPSESESRSGRAESSSTYQKLTDEQIRLCYQSGKKISEGENVADLADEIVAATGMNRNSAIIYLNGKVYKRAINISATEQYFDWIFNEYGVKGIQRALKATQLHINYRKECGHTVDSLEELYERYARRF